MRFAGCAGEEITPGFRAGPGPRFPVTLDAMRVAMMTREYPPEIYGGAGVHVTELTRFMRELDDVDVDAHSLGAPRDTAATYVPGADEALADAHPAIKTPPTGRRLRRAPATTR